MRVPMHSGTGKVTLGELQTALELVPGSDIYCLAFMANKRKCDEIPVASSKERDRILVKIADEMTRNGPAIASDGLEELLEQLARTLLCSEKPHWVKKRGLRCNQVKHVAGILRNELDHFEEARNTSRKMDAHIRSWIPAGREGRGGAPSSDESGGSSSENEGQSDNNSNDDELSERDDGPTAALAHRPRAIPHQQSATKTGQQISKSVEKTPNRIQQRASGSGRHRHQSDESDASTPGTPVSKVFSTGRSKLSAATVPTRGPLGSSSRSFLDKQRNETPTKQRRARDATDVEFRSDAHDVDEEGDVEEEDDATSHLQAVKHENSEPEDVLTEDDETPEMMMAFSKRKPSKSDPSTVNHVLTLMRSRINEAPHGYVYCFSTPRAGGLLKIGYAGIDEVQEMKPGAKLPISGYDRRARLWRRLESQNKKCNLEMKLEFDVYMPSAAHKMESLIHATLREHNRTVTHCSNPDCTVGHNEWFNVSLRDARHTVKAWERFSKLRPFAANGHLAEKWYTYAHDHVRKNTFAKLSPEVWLDKEWEKTVAQAGEERRQQKRHEARREKVRKKQLEKEEVKLRHAREEMIWAEKKLGEKKRQLEEMKKRRTTLE